MQSTPVSIEIGDVVRWQRTGRLDGGSTALAEVVVIKGNSVLIRWLTSKCKKWVGLRQLIKVSEREVEEYITRVSFI